MQESISGALVGAVRERAFGTDEIDNLIEKRAAQRQDVDEQEESWRESVRQYHGEHREARRHQWITYFRRLSASHRRISEDLERRAQALLDPGEGHR